MVLFNRHKADVPNWTSHNLTVSWGLLGMCASQTVRDLAQQRTPKGAKRPREKARMCALNVFWLEPLYSHHMSHLRKLSCCLCQALAGRICSRYRRNTPYGNRTTAGVMFFLARLFAQRRYLGEE